MTRKRKNLKVVHPIWSHVATLTDDPFWKEIYTQGSYGKMPKHFVYSNGVLGYSKGVKKYHSVLIPQEPTEAYRTSIQFFRENGLLSERDSMLIQDPEEEAIPDGYLCLEAIQRIRNNRKLFTELIIRDIAFRYCKENNIPQAINILYNILINAYKNKCLNEVLVKDQQIIGIAGLSHTHDGHIIYQSPHQPKAVKVKYTPIIEAIEPTFNVRNKSKVDMSKTWLSWVDTVNRELGRKETVRTHHETTITETD